MKITLLSLVAASVCLAGVGFVEATLFKKAIVASEVQTLVAAAVKAHMPKDKTTLDALKSILCSISKFWYEEKYHVVSNQLVIKPVNLVATTQKDNAIKTFKQFVLSFRGKSDKAKANEFNNKVLNDVLKEYKTSPEQELKDTDKEYLQLDCLVMGFTVKDFCDDKNVINLQPANVGLPAGSDAVGYVDDVVAQYTSDCGNHK